MEHQSTIVTRCGVLKTKSFFFCQENRLRHFLDSSCAQEAFVRSEIAKIPSGIKLLNAGVGDQKHRKFCNHLEYYAQNFGEYTVQQKKMLSSSGLRSTAGYK